ncbi:MAG: glycoside hydrolase family 127 protein, partial [Bacteroidaceae bacterium]|nr:glycoside hydrolase family 127 protein [Bacteroidaceae bacterium]
GWVKSGDFKIKVNGKDFGFVSGPSSYVCIDRKWKKGDVVDIEFPMHNSVKYLPNLPKYIALMHGPILLGMKTGTEDLAHLIADDSRFGHLATGKQLPIDKAPMLVCDNIEKIADDIKPIEGKPLHFSLGTKMINGIEGELQPFFEIHDSRYMMYWLAFTGDGYKAYLDQLSKEEEARQKLEAATVDKVQPGEQQPESDHFMETDKSFGGNQNNCGFRQTSNGSFFSYQMKTGGEKLLKVRLKFWGVDDWQSNEFDIFVDDVLVKSVNNTRKYRTSAFKFEEYEIPESAVKNKKQVRVKFVAHKNKDAKIYEVRLLKAE